MEKQSNIAVLGAGIMGLSAAYALRESGHNVTLVDPSPANNASAMAGGMLAPYSEIEHMPPDWIKAGLAGIEFWRGKPTFRQNGSLLLAHEEDRYILERFKTHLPHDAFEMTIAESELQKRFPNSILLPREAHIDPAAAMKFLSQNLKIETNTINEEDYDFIIDCRGMGADDQEVRGVKGETLIVRNPEFTLQRPVRMMHPRYPLYIVPREDNIFMIGATNVESAENTNVSLRSAMELMSALYALHPSFGEAEIVEIKAGIRPAYPDNLPQIKISGNKVSANGLFRHGFLLAPVMADVIADYMAGERHEFFQLFTKTDFANDENHHQRPGKKLRSAA